MDDVARQAITIVNAQDTTDDSCQAENTEIVPGKETCPSMGNKDVDDDWGEQEVYRDISRKNSVHIGGFELYKLEGEQYQFRKSHR